MQAYKKYVNTHLRICVNEHGRGYVMKQFPNAKRMNLATVCVLLRYKRCACAHKHSVYLDNLSVQTGVYIWLKVFAVPPVRSQYFVDVRACSTCQRHAGRFPPSCG